MNRREFVKALAGIPLLGLLVKVPKAEEEGSPTFVHSESYGLSVGSAAMARDGVLSTLRDNGLPISGKDWFYTTSSNSTNGPTMTYWDGQQWIPMKVDCPWSWRAGLA